MGRTSTHSTTVILGRMFDAPVAAVFAALVEPDLRERVGNAGGDVVVLPALCDCRVGGRELLKFGPRTNPRFSVECIYHDIVPESRIVATEIFTVEGERHAVALTTWQLDPKGARTQLRVAAHLILLHPSASSDVPRMRHESMLDALETVLDIVAAGER
ncbi:MAG: SRPBCC domain-containing protein [Hyphomicrobiaceae bacterium]